MKRKIIKIDEALCNGCGNCIPNCAEGALQMIDGKARLVSDLMCDGLGACLGHCPEGAITIEEREAAPYDEIAVIKEMIPKGKNTVKAHLKHLHDHKQTEFVQQAISYISSHQEELDFKLEEVHPGNTSKKACNHTHSIGGHACPGSAIREINRDQSNTESPENTKGISGNSMLEHWPVQLHLANPQAPYFNQSDLLIAADCTAFSMGNFHDALLKGKKLVIACPKLDSNQQSYIDKLISLMEEAQLNTITVAVMEVPCCSSLTRLVLHAMQQSSRKIPIKQVIVGVDGKIRTEEWINI